MELLGSLKVVTRSLSNSDSVTWCSKIFEMKTIGPSIEFALMSTILLLGKDICLSCFQAISLSSAWSLNKWFVLHNDAGNGTLG